MARYIDADELSRRMYHEAFEVDSDMQKWDSGCWIRYKVFENCIAATPAANVEEAIKHLETTAKELLDLEDVNQSHSFAKGITFSVAMIKNYLKDEEVEE